MAKIVIDQTQIVNVTPDENGAVTLALAHNTIYVIAATPTLTSLALTVQDGFHYAGLDFQTGATSPAFGTTTGWAFEGLGADWNYQNSSYTFVPRPNTKYKCALETDVRYGVRMKAIRDEG